MIKERINGLGEFEFCDGYFIGRIGEGVVAGPGFVDALSELIQKHFCGGHVIYISDRVNSYSLDPAATIDLIKRNKIRYAGVVVYTKRQKDVYSYEEQVLDGVTMCDFESLNDAIAWVKKKLPILD